MSIDTCVCCGGQVPEGRQVCLKCEEGMARTGEFKKFLGEKPVINNNRCNHPKYFVKYFRNFPKTT